MRKVFFSFKYEDVWQANNVRNSWVVQGKKEAGFIDKAEFEKLEKQGDKAIQKWIDEQMEGTSVTVVLVGRKTLSSRWVQYEIKKSIERGNGLFFVDITAIRDSQGNTSVRNFGIEDIPNGYSLYYWNEEVGFNNLGSWIEEAAQKAEK